MPSRDNLNGKVWSSHWDTPMWTDWVTNNSPKWFSKCGTLVFFLCYIFCCFLSILNWHHPSNTQGCTVDGISYFSFFFGVMNKNAQVMMQQTFHEMQWNYEDSSMVALEKAPSDNVEGHALFFLLMMANIWFSGVCMINFIFHWWQ